MSKAAATREYLEAHPSAKPAEVVAALAERGVQISAGYVTTIRQRMKKTAKKKTAKKKTAKRVRVERPYPRASLEDALKIVYAIKEKNGGNPWPPGDVAQAVDMSKATNSFFYAAASARDFGLTEGSRDTATISLSEAGHALAYAPDPESETALKRAAFLSVDLFRRVLDHYKGSNLPEMKYLSNTLQREFGLAPETHEEFSTLFRQNCQHLGIESGFRTVASDPGESSSGQVEAVAPTTLTLAEPDSKTNLVAFVVMPFVERHDSHSKGFFQEVLRTLITPAARDAGFNVRTANRTGSDVIQSTIINDLLAADLVIADLSEHNPNVLFELGIRMAKEKPVALIKASGTGRLFDVDNMLRVVEYNSNLWPTTVQKDLPDLTEHIRSAWDNRDTYPSYMKILLRSNKLLPA